MPTSVIKFNDKMNGTCTICYNLALSKTNIWAVPLINICFSILAPLCFFLTLFNKEGLNFISCPLNHPNNMIYY